MYTCEGRWGISESREKKKSHAKRQISWPPLLWKHFVLSWLRVRKYLKSKPSGGLKGLPWCFASNFFFTGCCSRDLAFRDEFHACGAVYCKNNNYLYCALGLYILWKKAKKLIKCLQRKRALPVYLHCFSLRTRLGKSSLSRNSLLCFCDRYFRGVSEVIALKLFQVLGLVW